MNGAVLELARLWKDCLWSLLSDKKGMSEVGLNKFCVAASFLPNFKEIVNIVQEVKLFSFITFVFQSVNKCYVSTMEEKQAVGM